MQEQTPPCQLFRRGDQTKTSHNESLNMRRLFEVQNREYPPRPPTIYNSNIRFFYGGSHKQSLKKSERRTGLSAIQERSNILSILNAMRPDSHNRPGRFTQSNHVPRNARYQHCCYDRAMQIYRNPHIKYMSFLKNARNTMHPKDKIPWNESQPFIVSLAKAVERPRAFESVVARGRPPTGDGPGDNTRGQGNTGIKGCRVNLIYPCKRSTSWCYQHPVFDLRALDLRASSETIISVHG